MITLKWCMLESGERWFVGLYKNDAYETFVIVEHSPRAINNAIEYFKDNGRL